MSGAGRIVRIVFTALGLAFVLTAFLQVLSGDWGRPQATAAVVVGLVCLGIAVAMRRMGGSV